MRNHACSLEWDLTAPARRNGTQTPVINLRWIAFKSSATTTNGYQLSLGRLGKLIAGTNVQMPLCK